ncbi:PPPDE putative thiol peptidase family protein [Rhynchospora pubera]|uniref:PPPDE putative thiol peptidase family protein n=1 Tax=Rhynchospora pubera TaxID=906938 RepID=A0AAV8H674_9POAL|nr:PPPDE putative thiol peptidase family protein [Rhynchospora pubera]
MGKKDKKDKKGSSRKGVTSNIYLNVYDLTPFNNYLYWFGLGVFHSGIQVYGMEYGYGAHDYSSSGVFEVEPRLCPGFHFRLSVRIGSTTLPRSDFQNFIQELASKYHGNSYNLISKNCNHFTEEVAEYLTGKPIPAWVNRLARLGSLFHCLLPDGIQVSQVRHVPSQTRRTSSDDGSDSLVSSIIDDEEDLLLMAPRLSDFSSSSSSTSPSHSNAISDSISSSHFNANTNRNGKTNTNTNAKTYNNSNLNSKSNSSTNFILNANSISNFNSHSRSHSQPHSLSHLPLHPHSQPHPSSHLPLHPHSHAHSHSYVFNFKDKDLLPPRLAKDIICSK